MKSEKQLQDEYKSAREMWKSNETQSFSKDYLRGYFEALNFALEGNTP